MGFALCRTVNRFLSDVAGFSLSCAVILCGSFELIISPVRRVISLWFSGKLRKKTKSDSDFYPLLSFGVLVVGLVLLGGNQI